MYSLSITRAFVCVPDRIVFIDINRQLQMSNKFIEQSFLTCKKSIYLFRRNTYFDAVDSAERNKRPVASFRNIDHGPEPRESGPLHLSIVNGGE